MTDATPAASDARAPYATEYCREARTRDGKTYRIRPIQENDRDRERDFINALSPESRHNRFLCMIREPSSSLVDRFVHVDYRSTMAIVATVGESDSERFIGVVRYARNPSDMEAEFAVTVADAWQGRGVGTALTSVLFDYARRQGLRRLTGYVLGSNQRMQSLARWLGMELSSVPSDPTLLAASIQLHR